MQFDRQLASYRALIERGLEEALPLPTEAWHEQLPPRSIVEAMRYSLLEGGKRLRGTMLLAFCELIGGCLTDALPFACALEMVHCYSLIHDDLPAMDNDDMRRGKPSSHKRFGEATAVLAGDSLLNLAYEMMLHSRHPGAMSAACEIAVRAGSRGMIAGQCADIFMEGKVPDEQMLRYIHRHKTADLFCAAALAGLRLAGADADELAMGQEYAVNIGLAFQIVDDLLDVQGSEQVVGKTLNKDAAAGKLTWPSLFGVPASTDAARQHVTLALQALDGFGPGAEFLRQLAVGTLERVQ